MQAAKGLTSLRRAGLQRCALPVGGAKGAAWSGTDSLCEHYGLTLVLPVQVAPQVQDDFDLPEEGLQEVDPRNREENQVRAPAQSKHIESRRLAGTQI